MSGDSVVHDDLYHPVVRRRPTTPLEPAAPEDPTDSAPGLPSTDG
jgi:hypothetical protein